MCFSAVVCVAPVICVLTGHEIGGKTLHDLTAIEGSVGIRSRTPRSYLLMLRLFWPEALHHWRSAAAPLAQCCTALLIPYTTDPLCYEHVIRQLYRVAVTLSLLSVDLWQQYASTFSALWHWDASVCTVIGRTIQLRPRAMLHAEFTQHACMFPL